MKPSWITVSPTNEQNNGSLSVVADFNSVFTINIKVKGL